MSILSAQSIRERGIVTPFCERTIFQGRSFGLSSAGYDVRLAEDIWLWPLYGRLASTIERFLMPMDLIGRVLDKSTNARQFVMVQNTVIEPGWAGYLTLELTRERPFPIFLRRGTPIAQVIFETMDYVTDQPYDGKYQNQQRGPQPAILEGALS